MPHLLMNHSVIMDLVVFSDANWESCTDDRKNTSAICVFFWDNLISCKYSKQKVVARPSTECVLCSLLCYH